MSLRAEEQTTSTVFARSGRSLSKKTFTSDSVSCRLFFDGRAVAIRKSGVLTQIGEVQKIYNTKLICPPVHVTFTEMAHAPNN
jgi:hypothetical protein